MSILSLQNTTLARLGGTETQDRSGSSEELWITISNLVGNLQPISYKEKIASGVPGVEYSHVFYTLDTPPAEQDILTSSTEQFRVAAIANYNQTSLDHSKVYLERLSSYDLLYLAGPPTGVVGTPHATGTSISVAFATPINGGGSTISYYTVNTYLSDGTPVSASTTTGASSPIVITGLTRATAYKFKVSATNSEGMSAYSDYSAAATVVDIVPDAPTSVVSTWASFTSSSVGFTPPVGNGGSAVTGYTVTASPGGATATGSTSPIVVSGLTTTSSFTVRATNAKGNSVESAASNSTVFNPSHYYYNNLTSGTTVPNSVVPATSGSIAIAEKLSNIGFETAGPGGANIWANWVETAGGGAIANATAAGEFHSGSNAAKLTYITGGAFVGIDNFAVDPGAAYQVSAWVRGDGRTRGIIRVLDSSHGYATLLNSGTALTTGTTFVNYVGSFAAPAGCYLACFYMYSPTSSGSAWFDDVSITTPNATWASTGYPSLLFAGGEQAAAVSSDLIGVGDKTISAWVKVSGVDPAGISSILSVDNGASYLNYYFNTSNVYRLVLKGGALTAVSDDNVLPIGSWTHIVATRAAGVSGIANIYVNGVLSGVPDQSSGTPVAGTSTYFGNRSDKLRDFLGNLGRVSTYDRVFTSTEVGLLYNMEKSTYGL